MAYFRQPPSSGGSANIVSKSITANGTYNASSDNADGYSPVTVNVPNPVLGPKSISANGTYMASADGYDGFSSVTVSVPGGAEATITVSYDSSFYNKTMTCTNGTKTYTKTTTSSGSTTFNVNEEGTWTITCNGVSRTVNVILSYSTQMAITKTVTVYGAVGATISFTDTTGSKTVTLNSSGQGSVNITFIPPSATITFTDTNVAKNPNNLSQNYSKTITMTDSIISVYVMPDGAVYWYGYKAVKYLTNIPTDSSVTENTNCINVYNPHRTGGRGSDCAITFNKITTGYSNLKAYITNVYVNINRLSVYTSYAQTGSLSGNPYIDITSDAITTLDITSAQSHYPLTGSFNGEINLHALWLE